jgi:hypothetical protein
MSISRPFVEPYWNARTVLPSLTFLMTEIRFAASYSKISRSHLPPEPLSDRPPHHTQTPVVVILFDVLSYLRRENPSIGRRFRESITGWHPLKKSSNAIGKKQIFKYKPLFK